MCLMATFTIRGKNIEITPSLREYVEKRVGKVTKYFEKVGEITVLLTVSMTEPSGWQLAISIACASPRSVM